MTQTNITLAKKNAAKIGVEVKVSTRKNKKLDVFKNGDKVASIGDKNYKDFLTHGDKKRQANYLARHAKTRTIKGSPSYYAAEILWR
ncbi:hypothetical protein PGVV14_0001 [Preplasmiviricota sp. Gezel-14T]|uniref:hypothetical protein n=1 Tax=Preplasmiviricota sp. Gezel-14T TaxID=1335638 RepID=UPI000332B991|nr:hypothetical protein M177_gp01 [Preplasmiviricota sp. Gezel-14T]AGM15747.1 hypothetical protein PGVV_00001 [Preplasmiviricota sp. Gezel-14T]UYE94477.1 hypothetical protein PGVV14_0001 [Preplasmiviricota sp. Gezel-14T]